MERNSIVTAPELTDADRAYQIWCRTHAGSGSVFYKFLTTPSAERDAFLSQLNGDSYFENGLFIKSYS